VKRLLGSIPPVARFAAVGLSGTLPNLLIIWLVTEVLGGSYIWSIILGAQAGVIWNFIFTDLIVFPGRRGRTLWGRAWRFFVVGNLDLLARLPLTILLVEWWGVAPVPAAAIIIAVVFIIKWLLVSKIIWPKYSP